MINWPPNPEECWKCQGEADGCRIISGEVVPICNKCHESINNIIWDAFHKHDPAKKPLVSIKKKKPKKGIPTHRAYNERPYDTPVFFMDSKKKDEE